MGRMSTGASDAALQRRELVASLVLRKLTQRQIVTALAEQGIFNPETGNPYDLTTIHKDVQILRTMWRQSATQQTGEHQAMILAELEEVKKAAWQSGELDKVLKAIGQQSQILFGTNVNLRGDADAPLTIRIVYDDKQHDEAE